MIASPQIHDMIWEVFDTAMAGDQRTALQMALTMVGDMVPENEAEEKAKRDLFEQGKALLAAEVTK